MLEQDIRPSDSGDEDSEEDFYDAEILDEMTTSRGELKLRTVSFKEEMLFRVRNQNFHSMNVS